MKIDVEALLQLITEHRAVAKGVIESEKVILTLDEEKIGVRSTDQAGLIISGEEKGKAFIVQYQMLSGVLSAMVGDKSVDITVSDDRMELVSETKTYQLPIITVTDEMKAEMFQPKAAENIANIALEQDILKNVDNIVRSIRRISAHSDIKTIIEKTDDYTTLCLGCSAAIAFMTTRTTNKGITSIEAKNDLIPIMLSKMQGMSGQPKIAIHDSYMSITSDKHTIIHTIPKMDKSQAMNRIRNLVKGKVASTTITIKASEMATCIKDAMAIAIKEDNIPIEFTKDGIKILVSSNASKYAFNGVPTNYAIKGEKETLSFPATIIHSVMTTIMEVCSDGNATISIYPSNRAKIITIGTSDCGSDLQYIFKVETVE